MPGEHVYDEILGGQQKKEALPEISARASRTSDMINRVSSARARLNLGRKGSFWMSRASVDGLGRFGIFDLDASVRTPPLDHTGRPGRRRLQEECVQCSSDFGTARILRR